MVRHSWLIGATALSGVVLALQRDGLPPSSARKTLNFEPEVETRSASLSSSSELAKLNSQIDRTALLGSFSSPSSDEATTFGIAIAESLLHQIHPKATYKLSSGYVSRNTGVAHVHLVQTSPLGSGDLAPVSNALANFNVDVDPSSKSFGHVISYSESFHSGSEGKEERIVNWHHTAEAVRDQKRRLKEWETSCAFALAKLAEKTPIVAAVADQVVFGSAPTELSEADADLSVRCNGPPPAHLTSPVDATAATAIVDPRVALVSFLTVAGSPSTQAHLSSQSSIEDLVESMWIRHPLRAEEGQAHGVEIMNAPGVAMVDEHHGEVPTKGSLAWMSVPVEGEKGRELQLVWRFEYRADLNWYEGYVDATRPSMVVGALDWVKDFRAPGDVASDLASLEKLAALRESLSGATYLKKNKTSCSIPFAINGTYRVFPWSVNDPSEGEREIISAPHHPVSSEAGWHSIPPAHSGELVKEGKEDWMYEPGWSSRTSRGMNLTDTRGNNVFAQENWEGYSRWENNGRPDGTNNLNFTFGLHWGPRENMTGRHIDPKSYIDASVTELFYTCNEIHDLFYLYGFDEISGNFQEFNFGRGGKGSDAVIANSQDGSGADLASSADHGQMRMYVWNGAEPWRDGDLEAGIVIHEYAHGISTRLTGGPMNSGCLAWGESGGMGEGWGDAFATLIRMHKKKPQDFSMGEWASRMKGGIRKYKYSLNHTLSPETYKTLDGPSYFGIGEVWAEMLYEVAESLIAKHGFADSLFPPVDAEKSDFYTTSTKTGKTYPKKGNTLFLQLVVDGMKLQPCRPKFMDARDAIIQADEILTGGENRCLLWKAFSSRGLGPQAKLVGGTPWGGGIRSEDFKFPTGCK